MMYFFDKYTRNILCSLLKVRLPTRAQIHANAASLYIHAARVARTCVFVSLFPLTHPAYHSLSLSLTLSLPLSTLEYRCPLLSLSLSSPLSIFHLCLTRREHVCLSSSFVSDLKTEGRSIGRFSSGFSSATTTPRRVEKLLSGLPIRAWKKIQVDRTHSREKDDGKEKWERG